MALGDVIHVRVNGNENLVMEELKKAGISKSGFIRFAIKNLIKKVVDEEGYIRTEIRDAISKEED